MAQNPKYKLLSGPLFLPAVVEMRGEKNQLLFSVLFLILKFKTGLFFSGSKVMNPQMPLCTLILRSGHKAYSIIAMSSVTLTSDLSLANPYLLQKLLGTCTPLFDTSF